MVKFAIISDEEYAVLSKYTDAAGAVLLPAHILKTFSPDVQAQFQALHEEGVVDYDFGGDPDVVLDVILSAGSYAYNELLKIDT